MLRQAGAEILVDNRDIAVVGLFEVFRHSRTIYQAWKTIKSHLLGQRPHVAVFIDFPDFNFLLARLARRLGSKVFYYISPQVWAWRSGRVRSLERLVDQMAVILPFEADFYARYGMKVSYVGHPLLDVLAEEQPPEAGRGPYPREKGGSIVGLLPGSRQSEIRSLLPLLLEAAVSIRQRLPNTTFLLPVAESVDRQELASILDRWKLPVRLVSGDTYGVIRACDLLLTASGTVTLEAAILGTPMIIIYRVSALTYYAGRHMIRVKYVGLPNLIAGRIIVPELLQWEARAERVAGEALALLNSPDRLRRQREELATIRSKLGTPGVADRVADLVLQNLNVT